MANLIGAIAGADSQSGYDAQAAQTQKEALDYIKNLNLPTVEEQQLQLALEQNAGQLSPQQEGTVKLGQNALSNITNNPELLKAQMGALQSLQQQGTEGLSASDKSALQQIENQLTQQANSQNQGTLQQFAQRGQAGSGASLAAQLMNNQQASNTANERALQIAGQAQQNALQATAQAGQLGTNIENQQYGQAANAANAQNAINQFNAANSQNVMGTNTQANNQGQLYNLMNKQNISNTNTGLKNQQQQYNKSLYQQQYEDALQKGQAMMGGSNSLAGTYQNTGQHSYNNTMGIANGAGQAIGQIAGMAGGGFGGGGAGAGFSPSQMASYEGPIDLNTMQPRVEYTGGMIEPNKMSKGGLAKTPEPGKTMSIFRMLNTGGEIVPAKLSPGEKYLTPEEVNKVEHGVSPKQVGHKVPGKAKVKGDSPKNDTEDADLEAGGLVIPRSIVHQSDNVIMDFIKAAKKHAKGGK